MPRKTPLPKPERPPVDVGFDALGERSEHGIQVRLSDTQELKWLMKRQILNLDEVLEDPARFDTLVIRRDYAEREGLVEVEE